MPHEQQPGTPLGAEQPLERGPLHGLVLKDLPGIAVAGREDHEAAGDGAGHHPGAQKGLRVLDMKAREQVGGPHGRHHEGSGHDRGGHVVGVLPEEPGIGEQAPETIDMNSPVRRERVGDRVLHPGVGRQDEIAGQPRPKEQHQGRRPMDLGAEPLLTEQQNPQKRRFQEEREKALHGQRLPDDTAGEIRELGPIGPELKLHGNAGHDPEGEAQREDLDPEACRSVIPVVFGPEGAGLQVQNQEGEPHGELGKEVMEGDRDGKLEAVVQQGSRH